MSINTLKSFNFAARVASILVLALLASCATVKPAEQTSKTPASTAEAASQPEAPAEPTPDQYPVKPFTKDQLYELLVAEIAGYRGQYDLALRNYLEVARQTGDPGVAARTTRLATYLKHERIALAAVKIWVKGEPDSIDAHRYAADLLMAQGDIKDAVANLAAIKRRGGDPDFPMFAYRAAGLSVQQRDVLIGEFDQLESEFPNDDDLQFSKALLLEQNGQFSEALAITNELLARRTDPNVVVLKVDALKKLDRDKEAMQLLDSSIKDMPDNRRLRLIYARMLFQDHRLSDALKQYEKVREKSPTDGDVLFALALISLEQNDYAAAHRYLDDMVRFHRRVSEAHFYLATLAEQQNDPDTALAQYKKVGDGREFLPAQARIASILFDKGNEHQARQWLESARQKYPDHYDQLIILEGQLLSQRGMESQVFKFLDKAIAADPQNTQLLYFRAMTGERFGHLNVLERDLKTIIKLDPDNADALNALGYTLTDQTDRHQEALKLIQRALQIKPNEPAYIDSLGWAMYRLGHYDKAVVELKKALRLFPNDEVAAHLGEVLWVSGKKSEANKVWDDALQRTPNSQVLKKVIHKFTGR